jgi:hypothetical protein
VFRTQSTARTVGWCLMLVCTVAGVAVLIRAEFLLRELDRRTGSAGTETDDHRP